MKSWQMAAPGSVHGLPVWSPVSCSLSSLPLPRNALVIHPPPPECQNRMLLAAAPRLWGLLLPAGKQGPAWVGWWQLERSVSLPPGGSPVPFPQTQAVEQLVDPLSHFGVRWVLCVG